MDYKIFQLQKIYLNCSHINYIILENVLKIDEYKKKKKMKRKENLIAFLSIEYAIRHIKPALYRELG